MRIVRSPAEVAGAFAGAAAEAQAAFGNSTMYIERYIERARHVEIQVISDGSGQIVHLGDRDCSTQRRHQKLIEEAPSPIVDEMLRARMAAAATQLASHVGYVNAGTVEFIVPQDSREFYFLEMNTRIQVEHPVTELVTGIDLVQWQLRIAAGERLPFKQEEIVPRGWAIECRITSEDTAHGFLPSTGRITYLRLPGGPGVRWDGAIGAGTEVGLHYDPLLAKLIVWAPTRDQAIARMHRALGELTVHGVETSREFHLRVMEDEEFRRGAIDIQWLERRLDSLVDAPPPRAQVEAAAVAAAMLAERDRRVRTPRSASSAAAGVVGAPGPPGARPELSPWARAARGQGLRSE